MCIRDTAAEEPLRCCQRKRAFDGLGYSTNDIKSPRHLHMELRIPEYEMQNNTLFLVF